MNSSALSKNFLFIIGSPRSGTSWLQLLLGAHPSVCTTAELRLYNKYIAPWMESWKEEAAYMEEGKPYTGLPVLWSEREFQDFVREFLERIYARVMVDKPEATYILDKHPYYSEYVELIHFFIPQARFIHVIRDGRDVAVSLFAASRDMGWFPSWSLPTYAMVWKRNVLAARKGRRFHEKYLEVRYEDLSTAPEKTLKSVYDFCGLPASDELIRQIVQRNRLEKLKYSRVSSGDVKIPQGHYREGKVGGWQSEFSALQRYEFDRIAGTLLWELGYARNGWWAVGFGQKLWVPLVAIAFKICQRAARAGAAFLSADNRPPQI